MLKQLKNPKDVLIKKTSLDMICPLKDLLRDELVSKFLNEVYLIVSRLRIVAVGFSEKFKESMICQEIRFTIDISDLKCEQKIYGLYA